MKYRFRTSSEIPPVTCVSQYSALDDRAKRSKEPLDECGIHAKGVPCVVHEPKGRLDVFAPKQLLMEHEDSARREHPSDIGEGEFRISTMFKHVDADDQVESAGRVELFNRGRVQLNLATANPADADGVDQL